MPVLVRTRRTASNPIGRSILWVRSWIKRSPSLAAYKIQHNNHNLSNAHLVNVHEQDVSSQNTQNNSKQ